ncbi:TPA: methyltransferase [Legionella pneumophila]|nr:methyltransferase [Legionella pneumophila]HAU1684744.1 methyltransferase [Legionella pneumophila]
MKSSEICPFGPKLQQYWDKRYDYFHRFDEGIQTDSEGLHTVMPEEAALTQAKLFNNEKIVVDGFCGIGGSAIALARRGKKVIAIEMDSVRLAMAKNNARVYGVEHLITFVHGDFFDVAAEIKADAVLIDPPWGWPRYRKIEEFHLQHFNPNGSKLISYVLDHFNKIVLRAPKTFITSELDQFNVNYEIHSDKLHHSIISISVCITNHSKRKPG